VTDAAHELRALLDAVKSKGKNAVAFYATS